MRQDITVNDTDVIRLDDDWGFPSGIVMGGVRIILVGPKTVDKMLCALMDLQRERDDIEARKANLPTQAEVLSEFYRMWDEDAQRDRMIEEAEHYDRIDEDA